MYANLYMRGRGEDGATFVADVITFVKNSANQEDIKKMQEIVDEFRLRKAM